MDKIKKNLDTILPKIIDIRKKLHQIPELKYEEFKTAKLISEVLNSFGYDVKENIAKTGLTALLDTGRPGKTIGLRADMDALPIEESGSHKYRSQHPGKMHACGHDGHCATMLAVSYVLHQLKDDLCGKIKFIFQPAEEGGGNGSTAMIEAGVLENPTIDEIYGFHNWPGLVEGVVATRAGTVLAGSGRIEITVKGKPAHSAQPEKAVNPVTIGAELITLLEKNQLNSVCNSTILNVLSFNSGELRGMAEKAEIVAVYYVENENDLDKLKIFIQESCNQIMEKFKTKITTSFIPFKSPTINTPAESENIINSAIQVYGDKNVLRLKKSLIASEDFSEYLKCVPGCFFLVGAGEMAGGIHTNQFQFNDNVISVAAHVICQTMIDLLSKENIV